MPKVLLFTKLFTRKLVDFIDINTLFLQRSFFFEHISSLATSVSISFKIDAIYSKCKFYVEITSFSVHDTDIIMDHQHKTDCCIFELTSMTFTLYKFIEYNDVIFTFIIMILFSSVVGAGLNVVRGHLAVYSVFLMRPAGLLQEVGAAEVTARGIFQRERDTS